MHGGEIELARLAQQLAQICDWILAGRVGEFVGERAHGECVRNVVDRAIPADPHMIGGRPVLATHVGDRIRHVGDALLELTGTAVGDVRLKGRLDRRKHGAVQPG